MKNRSEIIDRVEEIQIKALIENIGSNEEELQVREEVADLVIELVNSNSVLDDVSLSAYLFDVDGEACVVLGENIADAMDRLEKEQPDSHYEMKYSKSLDVIY